MINSQLFSQEQVQWIISNYGPLNRNELTIEFNKKFNANMKLTQFVSFIKNHKIRSGRNTKFKKGNVPWSAGTKGVCKPNSGSFKKGNRPYNYKPIGSERINGDGYLDVKIKDPNVWRAKHVVLWEEANGPLPKGHNIRFIDGNKFNINMSNLLLVNKAEHAVMNVNQLAEQPEQYRDSVILISKIQAKAAQLSKSA